jgi:hypothetical protein
MKKMLTLMIAAVSFVAVHAQTSKDEARKVILGQPKDNGAGTPSQQGRDIILGGGNNTGNNPNYPNNPNSNYPYGSRQAQIDQVNREYDAKVYSIRNNGTLTAAEKERMIRQLEKDREAKIRRINSYGKKDEKHDNGKHKGWTKGKGNAGKHKHDD